MQCTYSSKICAPREPGHSRPGCQVPPTMDSNLLEKLPVVPLAAEVTHASVQSKKPLWSKSFRQCPQNAFSEKAGSLGDLILCLWSSWSDNVPRKFPDASSTQNPISE